MRSDIADIPPRLCSYFAHSHKHTMSSLELRLEDWDAYITPSKELTTAVGDPNRNADEKRAGTTDYCGADIFHILNDFLQPNSQTMLQTAAKAILKLLLDAPYSNEVWKFGEIVIEIARQIPYHHPAHVKLARLMERVTSSKKFMKQQGVSIGSQLDRTSSSMANAVHSMSIFEHSVSRSQCATRIMVCHVPPPAHHPIIIAHRSATGPREQFPAERPNLMAFYAHIAATGIFGSSPVFAIWTLREAFEEKRAPWKRTFKGERDQWILGAAQFILYNGLQMLKETCCPEMEEELKALEPGLLCFGEHKLTRRRWDFWREGFKKAAEGEGKLSDECKEVARKAANLMVAIGESLTF